MRQDPLARAAVRPVCEHVFVMIVCVLIPRFELTTAVGDRSELLRAPVALAPEPGGTQQVGEVSLAAEAFGIHPRMRLGEALSRCPELTLVPPDPAGVADSWERLLVRLESVGAEFVEEIADELLDLGLLARGKLL